MAKKIREILPRSKEDKLGHLRFDRSRLTERHRWEAHIRDMKAAQREPYDPDAPTGSGSQTPPEHDAIEDQRGENE